MKKNTNANAGMPTEYPCKLAPGFAKPLRYQKCDLPHDV
jgi:hypothetical protein